MIRRACVTLGVLAVVGIARPVPIAQAGAATFVKQVPWYGNGTWLKIDTHIHTKFSDGSRTVDQIVGRAVPNGLDAIAITDHSDSNLTAATFSYFDAIRTARKNRPDLLIISGLEWNVPPHKGQGHVVVLVDTPAETQLAEFKAQFDDLRRTGENPQLGVAGLKWLAENATVDGLPPVAIYEHPSRSSAFDIDTIADFRRWRAVNDIVIGFSGAPGHQGTKPVGGYNGRKKTIERWDPVVATPGDAWDRLLSEGLDIWGASAPSDFHEDHYAGLADYWAGVFSETWVYAPERTIRGVLRALRAGSYFGDHGRIVRNVELRVAAEGLPRPAGAGETIEVSKGTKVDVALTFDVPEEGWRAGKQHIDVLELITIDKNRAQIVASEPPVGKGPPLSRTVQVDDDIVFRARGFQLLETGTRLAFYTNPVRVTVRK